EPRLLRPLPRSALRPLAGDVHHHRQLPRSGPAGPPRPDGGDRAAGLHRGGEAPDCPPLPGAEAGRRERSGRPRPALLRPGPPRPARPPTRRGPVVPPAGAERHAARSPARWPAARPVAVRLAPSRSRNTPAQPATTTTWPRTATMSAWRPASPGPRPAVTP